MATPRATNPRGRSVGRGRRAEETIDTSATDWQTAGKCAQPGADPEAWFPDGRLGHAEEGQWNAAKRACAGCPIAEPCGLFAIANKLDHGVWGGMTPSERAHRGERMLAAARERDAS